MIFINELQKETLLLVDKMINENKTFMEISRDLYDKGFLLSVEVKNGYESKTHYKIEKLNTDTGKCEYTFVDLIKRRNGLAYWETIKLS